MSIFFFVLAVIAYTISQLIMHSKIRFKGNYWSNDGRSKYKKGLPPAPDNWYYRFFKIKYKERFPGSATLFVSLTDGYHSSQMLFKGFLALTFGGFHFVTIVIFVMFGIIFTLTYKLLSNG